MIHPETEIKSPEQAANKFTMTMKTDSSPLVTLSWENIEVETPCKGGLFQKKTGSKQIIKNADGVAKPGQLMAIMGASGAGKTTLLNVLNYRNRGNLVVKGQVKINGQEVKNRAGIASLSGYVQQEDLFIGYLRVKEQLRFQAMLRMDASFTDIERNAKVEEIMLELNLKKCENTIIGFPERGVKGISGGERRRLAFACELITDPNLLFFDEPTSGLDSFMALSMVDSMRKMAHEKMKTIVCTIHQPSSEIFEKFDTLCLMAEGRPAFLGELTQAYDFFASMGLPVPANFNPADHYVNKLAVVASNREESVQVINRVCDGFRQSPIYTKLKDDIVQANKMSQMNEYSVKLPAYTTYTVSFGTQFSWLFWRDGLVTARDPLALRIAVIQTLFIALLLGLIFLGLSYDQTGVQSMNGVLFLFLSNASFSNMFAVLNTFSSEIPIFLREHANGMYSVLAYYLTKTVIDLPKFILLPFIQVTIVYWMANMNPNVGQFFMCVFIIILVTNTSVSFGSLLSAVTPNANAALGLAGPVLIPLMIFSGYFINTANMPVYFIWLRYLSWFSYSFENLVLNQWETISNISCAANSTCYYSNGADVIEFIKMDTSHWAINFMALVVIMIGLKVLTFVALFVKSIRD